MATTVRSLILHPLKRHILRSLSASSTSVKFLSSNTAQHDHDNDETIPNLLPHQIDDNNDDDLKSRIFRLRLPKRSAVNIIQKWVNEGRSVTLPQLRHISRDLLRANRYKHALEITEWMVSHDEYKLSDSDYAIRIDLMTKVFGIDAAERYFEGLPQDVITSETYTALLHSYASAKFTDKAEELFQRIKDSGLSFTAITYNEMMTLYMSVGQVEKVASVIQELKHQRVAPDLFTYNLWISSCAATLDIDGVKNVLAEMSQELSSNKGWERYWHLTNIYISTGELRNTTGTHLVAAEKGITQREWITYDFLIILHAGLGNKGMLDQIWKSLMMTKEKMIGRNYVPIISSYLMLGHMKEVEQVIDQWKNSSSSVFDSSLCDRLVNAFAEAGFTEKADAFRLLLDQKVSNVSDESK